MRLIKYLHQTTPGVYTGRIGATGILDDPWCTAFRRFTDALRARDMVGAVIQRKMYNGRTVYI